MFTGLVDSVGTIVQIVRTAAGLELEVECDYADLVSGESVAVNGVCLTVRERRAGGFSAAAIVTTLERTAIGHWKPGRRVNLERSLRLGDRLGGHFLQGHVDCVAKVTQLERRGDALLLDIALHHEIWELMAPHGSIAVDGVSLTVNEIPDEGVVQVALIEHTVSHTALADLSVSDDVHVEADIIAKHIRQMLVPYAQRIAAEQKQ